MDNLVVLLSAVAKHLAGMHDQLTHGRPSNHGLRTGESLQPFQERAVQKILKEPAVLVYHGLGSGKTVTSIAACEEVGGTKQIITPASLRYNYEKEINKFVDKPSGYKIRSYQNTISEDADQADITVVDEAHRMGREDTQVSKLPEALASSSRHVVFLTGTPVRNSPIEFVPMLKVLAADRGAPKNVDEFRKRFINQRVSFIGKLGKWLGVKPGVTEEMKNGNELAWMLRGRIDYNATQGNFPSVTQQTVELDMSNRQKQLYRDVLSQNPIVAYKIKLNLPPAKSEQSLFNAFMNVSRQLSNDPSAFDARLQTDVVGNSPKMSAIVSEVAYHIKNNPRYKAVIYSNWLDSGVKPVAEKLASMGIPTDMFIGGMSDDKRDAIVKRYNSGETRVLCISSAGGEGLDLKGTRQVHMMEPHWNQSKLEQVIGRAVRHNSHAHLPEEERKVEVKLYTTSPADKYLIGLSDRKKKLVDQFNAILQKASER